MISEKIQLGVVKYNENNKQDDLFNAVGFIALLSSFFE